MKYVCPVCLEKNGNYFVPVGTFKIYKCVNCGLEYTAPIPSAEQLQDFYSTYVDIRAAEEVVRANSLKNLKILEAFGYTCDKKILDFGSGNGNFVNVVGQNCYGIELHKSNNSRVFQNLSDLPFQQFDFVTLWGVLEHLTDPLSHLSQIVKLLNQNGFLAITTVDAESNIPYYYKPVEHLTYWTRKSFDHLASKLDLEIVEYKQYFMQQSSEIYLDRILSRTPIQYVSAFKESVKFLPNYVEIPTNEVLVVLKKN